MKTFTFLMAMLLATAVYSQQPHGIFWQADIAPVIDGSVDSVWGETYAFPIENALGDDQPTLGPYGVTYWKGMWDKNGIYILVVVGDDFWYPSYKIPFAYHWEYDKVELYFDVNYLLEDGLGAANIGSGHWQVAPAAEESKVNGIPVTQPDGIKYAYKVTEPTWKVEYFIPWSYLRDSDGLTFDKTAQMGFDVTIVDRDPMDSSRRLAVWASTNYHSWNNMDEAGVVILDGMDWYIPVDSIIVSGGNITTPKGTLQLEATILPADATEKTLQWTIENITGIATINDSGLVTALADGLVRVTAKTIDFTGAFATADVFISGQQPSEWDFNLIKNGSFDSITSNSTAAFWGFWTDGAPVPIVKDGVSVHFPKAEGEVWQYLFSQDKLMAKADTRYILKFKAWADAPRPLTVIFEDSPMNDYNRYGASDDPTAVNGRSEWLFNITQQPTWYTFHVVFDQIQPSTVQTIIYHLGGSPYVTYLDSIILVPDTAVGPIIPAWNLFTKDITTEIDSIFTIPVIVRNILSEDEIISYGFNYQYDSNSIEYLGSSLRGTIAGEGLLTTNPTPGNIAVAWARNTPLSGEGIILNMQFKAKRPGITTPQITNALLNTKAVKYYPGSINIRQDYTYGDIDANGLIQAYDAALALQYSVGIDPLPRIDPLPWERWRVSASDVDGQGGVTAYDAAQILRYTVGLIDVFDVQQKTGNSEQADVNILVEDGELIFVAEGELYGLNVSVDNNDGLLGDAMLTSSALFSTHTRQGNYAIGFATAYPPQDGVPFLKIPFTADLQKSVSLDLILNNDYKTINLVLTSADGEALMDNVSVFPSPVGETLHVRGVDNARMSVYDINGRLVAEGIEGVDKLEMGHLLPGYYTLRIEMSDKVVFRKVIKH